MAEPVATEIRFFDLQSRIGRLRYLAYGLGLWLLASVPAFVGSLLFAVSGVLGMAVLALTYIAAIVLSIGFGVRRLHDLDKSGWWLLLMIVPLVNLGLAIYLLFFPGTIGENRFGSQPPPNSTWVIIGSLAYILIIPAGIIAALTIPTYASYVARAQMTEGVMLATGAESAVAEYAQDNRSWPTDLGQIYPAAQQHPAGKYADSVTATVSSDGSTYSIVSAMKTEGVTSSIAGATMEVWSNDGGMSWHCGPGGANPAEPMYLPTTCRETGAP